MGWRRNGNSAACCKFCDDDDDDLDDVEEGGGGGMRSRGKDGTHAGESPLGSDSMDITC